MWIGVEVWTDGLVRPVVNLVPLKLDLFAKGEEEDVGLPLVVVVDLFTAGGVGEYRPPLYVDLAGLIGD